MEGFDAGVAAEPCAQAFVVLRAEITGEPCGERVAFVERNGDDRERDRFHGRRHVRGRHRKE